ncbi:MAG: hypothetical protein ACFUZC_05615 [Chthoniobacteraceae bacterium]
MKLIVVLLLAMAGAAFGEVELPGIVMDGLDGYYRYGAKSALDIWTKGALPGIKDTLADATTKWEQAYGKVVGFEKVRVVSVCPSFIRVYALIKYEYGPGFITFDCYRPEPDGHHWIVFGVNFDLSERCFQ